jgi:carboxyl-terminal processing protease
MWNTVKWGLTGLIVFLVVTLSGVVGYAIADDDDGSSQVDGRGDAASSDSNADFGVLSEVEQILEEDFVNPDAVTDEVLERGSIDGIIAALGDPHTIYISPEDFASGIDIISGSFQGIGANVDQDPTTGEITIVAPFRGSPAEEAGILPGDVILAVDGESTEGWSVADAVERIRGEEGTTVTLTVRHSDRTTEELPITRGTIVIPTVFSHDVMDENGEVVPDLTYIEIQQFTDQTVADLSNELERVVAEGYKGLVLDLRRNPGGGLDATVAVADMFLDGGTVLTQVDREGDETVYEASEGGEAVDIPVAILVSEGSASGSEVLAGALRDHGRATLIGTQTFGKGSVNHIRELSNGGALYVTIARWLTPNGTLIEGVGLTPDVPVELDPQVLSDELQNGYGPQMTAAIAALNEQLAAAAQ